MILYHITTTYHLLSAMIYTKKKSEKSTALCSVWIREKFPKIDELKSFFDEVIFADFNYRFFHTDKETARYFENLIGDPKRYSEIYVWGAQFSFGFFLNYRNIPYIHCEEAAGIDSRPDILRNIEKKEALKSRFWEQCDSYGAYDGSGVNVQKRLYNKSAQTEDFQVDDSFIDFNVVSELYALTGNERNKIINFFNIPTGICIRKDATIILTQHLANLGITTFEGQALLYQIVVDYFFDEASLVFKPHPDDLMYYKQLFPEAEIIHERFPSEFMPFIFDNQPECVATISSTAIFNLRGHYPKVFELDTRYEKDYPFTHRYYAALRIVQKLGLNVVCYNANELLAQRLTETLGEHAPLVKNELLKDESPMMLLIDDVTLKGEAGRAEVLSLLQNLDDDSCAVLINSKSDYCWYSYEHRDIWKDMAPIVLRKTAFEPKSEDFYASEQDEVLYIYSKNREILKMAKETEITKDLIHTGIKVESMKLDSKDERIKMLEGILAATEKRLLYYIEKENQEK